MVGNCLENRFGIYTQILLRGGGNPLSPSLWAAIAKYQGVGGDHNWRGWENPRSRH